MNFRSHHTMSAIAIGSAVIYGWWAHGWQGLLVGVLVAGLWAWYQFRRDRQLLATASTRPPGEVDSVVTLQAQLAHGMQMAEVVALAGCLGRAYNAHDEWQWLDGAGNEIVVTFRRGVVVRWAVARAEPAPERPLSHTGAPGAEPPAPFSALARRSSAA
jgi:hypothetical protein